MHGNIGLNRDRGCSFKGSLRVPARRETGPPGGVVFLLPYVPEGLSPERPGMHGNIGEVSGWSVTSAVNQPLVLGSILRRRTATRIPRE